MQRLFTLLGAVPVVALATGCWVDSEWDRLPAADMTLEQVARMFSELPIGAGQMAEVEDAVSCSADNGYDEEYLMSDLFSSPGSGVRASAAQTKAEGAYDRPLRTLIREYLSSRPSTKGGGAAADIEASIEALAASGTQIYWPYHENWDGESLPVITFDPGGDATTNVGYLMEEGPSGERMVREVTVSEQMARERPVWVINTNDDSSYTSLEILRREDPDWGGGGSVVVTKAGAGDDFHSLVLRDFTMNRHYDPWFAGASEFFVKCGYLDGFTASTEAEMRLYSPTVTDFMIVVRRRQLGESVPFNAVLISDWTDQLEQFAFMITEDDGGTQTKWDFEVTVKVQSKSYGVSVSLPIRVRDDIVWRGGLTSRYFEHYSGQVEHFGDVDLTFELR